MLNIRFSEFRQISLQISSYLIINHKQVALLTLLTCLLLATVLFHTQSEGTNELGTREGGKFNFVAAGDFGCNSDANNTVAAMVKKNPEIVLALGDLSY